MKALFLSFGEKFVHKLITDNYYWKYIIKYEITIVRYFVDHLGIKRWITKVCSPIESFDLIGEDSTEKIKMKTFKRKCPVRLETVLENKNFEQIFHFSYLGCDINCDDLKIEMNCDVDNNVKNKMNQLNFI